MMSLNNINTSPVYELTVPSTKKKVKYRPYNVGEQKKLLLAHIEEDKEAILLAVRDMIENCTFGKIDFEDSPSFDIEYIMVKLRAKSAGEVIDVGAKCTSCEELFPVQINLENVVVTGKAEKNIKLSDDLFIVMKYPTIRNAASFNPDDIDSIFDQIASCVESIVYQDDVFDAKEQTQQAIASFLERLTESQIEAVKKFFQDMPKVEYNSQNICPHCKAENQIHVTGITNFFI